MIKILTFFLLVLPLSSCARFAQKNNGMQRDDNNPPIISKEKRSNSKFPLNFPKYHPHAFISDLTEFSRKKRKCKQRLNGFFWFEQATTWNRYFPFYPQKNTLD